MSITPKKTPPPTPPALPTPAEIRARLDEYVVEQDDAKRVLSVAVYNHYKRAQYNSEMSARPVAGRIELKKSNILMVGPTGCGKTLIASTLSRILNVPFAMGDATALIAAGSAGKNLENILATLIQSAEFNIPRAEQGIVYIDEIDKLAKRDYNRGAGEGIQQQMLKIIEGTICEVPISGKIFKINTDNILFIVGGAFVGLSTIAQLRIGDTSAGLLEESDLLKKVTPEDLAKFGLIPEFVGRLPVLVGLHALNKAALMEALIRPKNSLMEQYKKMFAIDHVDLVFDDACIERIAELAMELRTGARGLRTIMEDRMLDIMYNVPNEKNLCRITITAQVIDKIGEPRLEYVQATEEIELAPLAQKISRNTIAFSD